MKMKRRSFLTSALTCLMALCVSLSAWTAFKTVKANEVQNKTLTYDVSCFNAAGEAKGSLNATPWDAMKAKGCKYAAVNIIFGTDARYITVAFKEAISAEDYSSIEFGMNFYGGSTITNNASKAQIYKPALVDGKANGKERTETGIEVDAGWYIDSSNDQKAEMDVPVSRVSIPSDALKQDDGMVYGFTIRCAAEASGGAHFAIMSDIVAKAETTDKEAETSEVSVVYDFDGTQVYGKYSTGGEAETDLRYCADNDPNAPVFAGDGSTQIAYTNNLGADGWVKIEFAKKVKAEDFPRMVLRYCAGNWKGETITRLYKLSDTGFNTVIEELKTAFGNTCASWTIDTDKIADADGYVRGFMLKRDDTAEGNMGQYFFDYVQFLFDANIPTTDKEAETSEVSVVYDFDGTQVYGKYSNGAEDETHQNIDLHYSADDNPNAPVFAGDGSTQMAFTGGAGLATDGWVKIEFAKKVKAEDFPRMVLRYCAGNWEGETITRLYTLSDIGFNTVIEELKTAFGNTCASWAIDTDKIADADGYVRGFMLKRDDTVEGHKGQYFFDYVQFLIDADIPKYEVSDVYLEKDVTEVMPVGEGFNFELKAENYASEHIAAAVETKAFDVLNANIKVTYTDNYSFYFLVKATSADSHYNNSGIMFWFANDNITIGAIKDGKRNITSVSATDKPEIVFESGKAVNVKMSAIPTYLEGVQTGYTLNVYINDAEVSVLTLYLANGDIAMGSYTNIVTQDLNKDFAVEIKTAGETAYSAKELMKVEIATSTGNTEYTKNKAIIKTSHFAVAGETVSDVRVEGDATYNAETGVLTFNTNGTVKLSYTVTNAFGTFDSNVLELKYDDGTSVEPEPDNGCEGCSSAVTGKGGLLAVVCLAAACLIFRKNKSKNI